MLRRPLLLFAFFAACSFSGSSTDDEGPDAGDGDPGPDYSDADWLFESDRLLDIDIELAAADWDVLRFQTRNILEILGPDCGDAPAPKVFTYQMATVTIDGQEVANVGVRKKGFLGSLDEDKPSLKIKFNEFVPGQRFSGTKRLTLNNNVQDPSAMNQCLGYALFSQAGVPAPRCNFARVSVNGQALGVYTHVESVKKPFLALHFDDNSGNLYEGTLSDFRDGWTATFDRKTNESEPPGSEDRSDIDAITDALALGDAQMLSTLETLVDLESFYKFWAVEAMLSHWDGYAGNNNNYFIYGDPTTGKFTFMPWGIDQLFGGPGDLASTRSAMTRRLFLAQPSRTALLDEFNAILDDVWSDSALLDEVDRIESLIGDSIAPTRRADFQAGVSQLRATLNGRGQQLRNSVASLGAQDAAPLADPLCFADVGPASSNIGTNYGQQATVASLAVTLNGTPQTFTNVTAYIGPDDEQPGTTVIFLSAVDGADRDVIFFLSLPNELATPGTIDVGKGVVQAILFATPQGAQDPEDVFFLSGTLDLAAAGATGGAAWDATFDLRVWDPPFF